MAVSVNHIDVDTRVAVSSEEQSPIILGYDGSGVIESIGEEVSMFAIGDEVFYAGAPNRAGSNAEYTLVDERLLATKPTSLTFEDSAALPLASIAAYECLVEMLRLNPVTEEDVFVDQSLLIINGAGGVGTMLLQLAKKYVKLQTVIATASKDDSIEWCKRHGADHIVNHLEPLAPQLADYSSKLPTVVNGQGYIDFIIVAYDPAVHWDCICKLIAPCGHIILLSDPSTPLDLLPLKRKRVSVAWEYVFSRVEYDMEPSHHNLLLSDIARLVDEGIITHPRTESFLLSLETLRKAHAMVESGDMMGKVVLTVSSSSFSDGSKPRRGATVRKGATSRASKL
eukprot:GILK01005261.1.p1 GENE.GILK01005261.1~~GILK01005261.1.p1  ORF type:complete len:391 (-),score=39.88 GILK01005261.1:121-1140(-)